MNFNHKEIFLLFIAVFAGYLARYIYNEYPLSLIISAVTIVIVYSLLDFILKKMA